MGVGEDKTHLRLPHGRLWVAAALYWFYAVGLVVFCDRLVILYVEIVKGFALTVVLVSCDSCELACFSLEFTLSSWHSFYLCICQE